MQNIALVFIKLGQYSDAVTSYEHIIGEKPEVESCFNLLLCYYAMGDREKMKKTFQRLVQITVGPEDEEKYNPVLVCLDFHYVGTPFPKRKLNVCALEKPKTTRKFSLIKSTSKYSTALLYVFYLLLRRQV